MSKAKPSNIPTPKAEEFYRKSVMLFLAKLRLVIGMPEKQADFQAALQTYCDRLRPWLVPSDRSPTAAGRFLPPRALEFNESGDQISVILSPDVEALFRAWLRRNQIWCDAGLTTAHAWSN